MMFLDCPAFLDRARTVRCGLPAEVRCRFTMCSTDGPLDSAMIRCSAGHHFSAPIEALTWDGKNQQDPGTPAAGSRAGHDSRSGSHDARAGSAGSAVRDLPAEPEPGVSLPSTAPAYYLGHPAHVWITVLRPRRGRTTSDHRTPAVRLGNEHTARTLTRATLQRTKD